MFIIHYSEYNKRLVGCSLELTSMELILTTKRALFVEELNCLWNQATLSRS